MSEKDFEKRRDGTVVNTNKGALQRAKDAKAKRLSKAERMDDFDDRLSGLENSLSTIISMLQKEEK
jgi:hypothetical protein